MDNNHLTCPVPAWAVGKVRVAIERINRRATRLGQAAFAVAVGEPRLVQAREGYEEWVDVTISGAPVQVSGYRLLGRVDFEDGAIIVNSRPGEDMPPRYRHATTDCEHCAVKRQRANVFVFRRNGDNQHVQVGRTCLGDFLGHDPQAVLWSANVWSEISGALDEACQGGGRQVDAVGVERVLELAAAVVREQRGFVSKAYAGAHDGAVATSGLVFEQLFPPSPIPRGWHRVEVLPEDTERAAAARAWVLESMRKPEQSDYEYNMVTLVEQDIIRVRRMGLVVSAIGAYDRHLGDREARARRVDAHVGQVGQRRDFVATFAGQHAFDTAYGVIYIGRFETPEGLLVYRGSAPFWPSNAVAGDELRFKATIKEHGDYKGAKQTTIQRATMG